MKTKESKGITILALVITIIVLLILAGITISAITGNNGIIGNAGKAKEDTEIANEKEIVEKATIQAMGNNKYGHIEESELQEQLDKETGEGKTEASNIGDEFEVIFIESKRYYIVEEEGNVQGEYLIIEDKHPGDITVGKNGEELDGKAETEGGKPYEIWCIEDLAEWSQNYDAYQDAYIKLGRTLNFESRLSYVDGRVLNCNSIDELRDLLTDISGSGFMPIKNFSGTFDGQSNEIQNIYINKTGRAGVFENINNAHIENLGIDGKISGTEWVGGISGYITGKVEINECYNKADIISKGEESKAYVGGICGHLGTGNLIIINSYNAEQANINGNVAGGIIGMTGTASSISYIYNCYNLGNINGITVGGIIGFVYDHTRCINVYSTGNITGTTIGGIVGAALWNNASQNKFENCYFLKSNTVQQDAGKNITVNATMLEELTNETIDELNTYITNNSTLTSGWKKWTIENRNPKFMEEMEKND